MALDYKAYLENVINRKDYVLAEMEERIDKCWLDGKITSDDREYLIQLAADNARDDRQIDIAAKFADLEQRVYALEHPTDQYAIWEPGYVTKQHEIVRFDVTGDGEYDLCQYNGGRAETALSIGKIDGWNMLNIELVPTHIITRDASGAYILTPIEEQMPDLDTMTKAELIAYAQEQGVTVYESWTKAEIIAAIRGE